MSKWVTWLTTHDTLLVCEQTRVGLEFFILCITTSNENTEKVCSGDKKILFRHSHAVVSEGGEENSSCEWIFTVYYSSELKIEKRKIRIGRCVDIVLCMLF